jgi:hypothetical protein
MLGFAMRMEMDNPAEKPRRLLRRHQASRYLEEVHGIKRSPKTLAKYAVLGGGPPFRKDGKTPLYAPPDLDAYAESRLSKLVHSTSELRAA